jgi:hypothetical protein
VHPRNLLHKRCADEDLSSDMEDMIHHKKKQFDDREYLLRRADKVSKRRKLKIEAAEPRDLELEVAVMKEGLCNFQGDETTLLLEQAILHHELNEKDEFMRIMDSQLGKVLDNLLLKQQMQDMMIKLNP